MRTNLYSIHDTVAGIFNKPFTEFNDDSARRMFKTSILNEQMANKDDFVLYALGEFDDQDGSIIVQKTPIKIMSGFDIKMGESITPETQRNDLELVDNC